MTEKKLTQRELGDIVWAACDTFRGAVDPAEYKNYILTMLFIKYMSDLYKDRKDVYEERYEGNQERIKRALERERFRVPETATFDYLYSKRDAANIGEIINKALEKIEDENKTKLEGVFRNIDFNSEAALGETKDRNRRLTNLLDDFADERLDLRPSVVGNRDIIGDVYEYLIGKFAADAGKKAGEFYTPPEVSILLAKLVDPQPGNRICDPACGSCGFLLAAHAYITSHHPRLTRARKRHLQLKAFRGVELVDAVARLGAMTLLLHVIGPTADEGEPRIMDFGLVA